MILILRFTHVIFLSVCKASFYVFNKFMEHMSSHQENMMTRCLKCKEQTNKATLLKHLCSCFGFGHFQCVYCKFGSSDFPGIDNHIAEKHSTMIPYYCERAPPMFSAVQKVKSNIHFNIIKQ